MLTVSAHHYAFDAASLLDECMNNLQETIDKDIHGVHDALYDMKKSFISLERLLHGHILKLIELELEKLHARTHSNHQYRFLHHQSFQPNQHSTTSLAASIKELKAILEEQKQWKLQYGRIAQNPQEESSMLSPSSDEQNASEGNFTTQQQQQNSRTYYQSRSATDTLLFRLIVALQLCLVRIDDAHFVITGRRKNTQQPKEPKSQRDIATSSATAATPLLVAAVGVAAVTAVVSYSSISQKINPDRTPNNRGSIRNESSAGTSKHALVVLQQLFLPLSSSSSTNWTGPNGRGGPLVFKIGITALIAQWIRNRWNAMWMTDKIVRSKSAIDEWQQQWQMVLYSNNVTQRGLPFSSIDEQINQQQQQQQREEAEEEKTAELLDARSRLLIEYAMKETPKSYFWQSQGEMRFLMLKRAMDVFYASVGTAMDTIDGSTTSSWQLPLVTAAAASFYSLTGASKKALQTVNSPAVSQRRDLIRHAWGMVSLPAIKSLMLQASRLLKGAAVADRIEINGIACFILSREPAPELAATLKRQHSRRRSSRRSTVPSSFPSYMSTISETEATQQQQHHDASSLESEQQTFDSSSSFPAAKFAGTSGRYRQRDVILHLTGGGFFAHTIASDLPYLLDWSAATGAVVICPEYALLPNHTFPVALNQIKEVYSALLQDDRVVHQLGFEVNRIILTGESAGGNLAAALCVKLGMQQLEHEQQILKPPSIHTVQQEDSAFMSMDGAKASNAVQPTRMPNGMMLSCAALNLSLELSYSRVIGTQDPVLPSGLISAISDAYLPADRGFTKQDPLASPFFAPDKVLQLFPPTLMFAGSNDPLLDDSVGFNERLRCLGVKSELRAAHNMPHAYWGLGTAGFPEAQQVQQECEEWLCHQFATSS